jgi:hypothetical protein
MNYNDLNYLMKNVCIKTIGREQSVCVSKKENTCSIINSASFINKLKLIVNTNAFIDTSILFNFYENDVYWHLYHYICNS